MTFREIYDAHFDFVWRTLRRLNVAEADIADAVQEIFLVVHRRLPNFEGRAKLTTWLFKICLRVAKDRHRRAHVRREVPQGGELARWADPQADPEQETERRSDLALLEAALEQLDLEQRAVFTLFEFEGMTGQDIARTLEIPLGTVYSRLRLARESFRKAVLRRTARDRLQIRTREGQS
jgi:RNA polymerase sigma-70 factor (ECF subfamily)